MEVDARVRGRVSARDWVGEAFLQAGPHCSRHTMNNWRTLHVGVTVTVTIRVTIMVGVTNMVRILFNDSYGSGRS